MLVLKARRYYKTTNSRHWIHKYPNLIKEIDINKPEQIWIADISYLRTRGKAHYLPLTTDACSRKILGYNISDNLMATSVLEELKMATLIENM